MNMNNNFDCSLNDTSKLRNLIIENPELPLLFFCSENSWSGEWAYTQGEASDGDIECLTLYNDMWLNKDDCEEELRDDLIDSGEYDDLSDEEFDKVVKQKIEEIEFIKAIVVYIG